MNATEANQKSGTGGRRQVGSHDQCVLCIDRGQVVDFSEKPTITANYTVIVAAHLVTNLERTHRQSDLGGVCLSQDKNILPSKLHTILFFSAIDLKIQDNNLLVLHVYCQRLIHPIKPDQAFGNHNRLAEQVLQRKIEVRMSSTASYLKV